MSKRHAGLKLLKKVEGKAVEEWATEDVIQWVHANQLASYEEQFRRVQVTGAFLLALTPERLTKMGITVLKQRKPVLELQAACRSQPRAIAEQKQHDNHDEEFNEEASHQSFLEALHAWRGSNEPKTPKHTVATETSQPSRCICWQCFHTISRDTSFHAHGYNFCSKACEAAYATEKRREELVDQALESSAQLQRHFIQSTWQLSITF
ncbi:hypothetical protein AC1031_001947 [Aphanomyces cochlioides]|nr:hypothetical protein AC1031_001947 [Aphanomyces cochlioides]